MIIEDGTIVACTDDELYEYWLRREYDDLYSYLEFRQSMVNLGTVVIGPKGQSDEEGQE